MKSNSYLTASVRRIIAMGMAVATAATVSAVHAQTPQPQIEEVVVTGSFIRGIPEDGSIPVDQITIEDLEQRGSPPPLEMLKSLSYMAGIVGESNPFTSGRGQASEGTASINLRGFGAERTLVLLNGKRLPSGDANRLPANAIARVEVLKDGGAATYGSDAIGGVVNYITKTTTDGLELTGDYRGISDSDGDYNLGLAWGGEVGGGDLLFTANYYHRSPLLTRDRDWAITPYELNPEGGWTTGSNPGAFRTTYFTPMFADPQCDEFGGVLTNSNGVPVDTDATQCRTQYTVWDQLVDKQDTVQLYSQYKYSFDNGSDLHVEALYALTDTPYTNIAPSFTTTRGITSTVNPGGLGQSSAFRDPAVGQVFTIPAANPGYQLFKAQNPAIAAASPGAAYAVLNQWRPFQLGGNPMFGYGESHQARKRDSMRLSAELTGDLTPNLGYSTSLTYGRAKTTRKEYDMSVGKLQLALRGLGGEDCNTGLGTSAFQPGTPGVGACQWFNPFSNAVPGNPISGYVNPTYDPAVANSAELVSWMTDRHRSDAVVESSEFNFILNGDLNSVDFGAGAASFAAGVQYRYNTSDQTYNQFANALTSPCLDTPINGDMDCLPQGESPYNFLATYEPVYVARGVYALFGEVFVPVTDSFTAQIAARFEDYGNKGGNSFDPNIRLRWQATDMVAFRASAGTTFRAPPQTSLLLRESTGFANVLGSNRPVSSSGNPDLKPETSTNYNFGVMLSGDAWNASVDYWRFDIDDILGNEPMLGILSTVFPTATTDLCASTPQAYLDRYFDFSGGVCSADNILRVKTYAINGAGFTNDGIDVAGDYTWYGVANGDLSVGASATWINKYQTDDLTINGTLMERGFDGAGFMNLQTTLAPLPELRGSAFLNYSLMDTNFRWTTQYIDSYIDQRDGIFVISQAGRKISSWVTHNLTVRHDLGNNVVLTASIDNLMDNDPPFARTEINYDAVTHSPMGRTFKIGAKVNF